MLIYNEQNQIQSSSIKIDKQIADRYKSLEEENNNLKREIKDLSQTLLIKEIIQKFIQNSSIDDKSQFMIEQQKKRIKSINRN